MKNAAHLQLPVSSGFWIVKCITVLSVPLFLWCAWIPRDEVQVPIVINEFMAKNTAENPQHILDENGEADDWLELYNPADTAVRCEGLYLSDDSTSRRKFALFDTVLPPRGYLLIWADDQSEQGRHHADFGISATDGDEIILSTAQGRIIDRIMFFANCNNPEARLPNQSYGRSTSGSGTWCRQASATPLLDNSGCAQ
jgi:hypothetical protein